MLALTIASIDHIVHATAHNLMQNLSIPMRYSALEFYCWK